MTEHDNSIHTAVETAKKIGKPFRVNDIDAVLVPDGCTVQTFEKLYKVPEKHPGQLKETITVEDAKSFIDYYNRFANDHSTIFVDTEAETFTAIIDYHEDAENPQWGNHKIVYKCPRTPEWSTWLSESGRKNAKTQEEFALFVETNLAEIQDPPSAEMLEIALSLRAKSNTKFQSAVRLDNGQNQLTYIEAIDGTAGNKGQLKIPDEIILGIAPFKGAEPYEVRAKFRYRIKEGILFMWYDLIRPHKVIDSALNDARTEIADKIKTGMMISGNL